MKIPQLVRDFHGKASARSIEKVAVRSHGDQGNRLAAKVEAVSLAQIVNAK
jgi:hypothetical protein